MKTAAPETRLMISGAVGFYHIVHKDFHAGFDLFAVLIKTAIHNFYAFFGRELETKSGEGERVTVKFHQISKSRRLLPSRSAANPQSSFHSLWGTPAACHLPLGGRLI